MEFTSLLMATPTWQIESLAVSERYSQLQKRKPANLLTSGVVLEAGMVPWHTGPMSEKRTGMVAALLPAIMQLVGLGEEHGGVPQGVAPPTAFGDTTRTAGSESNARNSAIFGSI
jgi:hypothetical protein